jgi:hypothetical protein
MLVVMFIRQRTKLLNSDGAFVLSSARIVPRARSPPFVACRSCRSASTFELVQAILWCDPPRIKLNLRKL